MFYGHQFDPWLHLIRSKRLRKLQWWLYATSVALHLPSHFPSCLPILITTVFRFIGKNAIVKKETAAHFLMHHLPVPGICFMMEIPEALHNGCVQNRRVTGFVTCDHWSFASSTGILEPVMDLWMSHALPRHINDRGSGVVLDSSACSEMSITDRQQKWDSNHHHHQDRYLPIPAIRTFASYHSTTHHHHHHHHHHHPPTIHPQPPITNHSPSPTTS